MKSQKILTYYEYELLVKQHFEREIERSLRKRIIIKHQQNLVSPDGNSFNIDLSYRFKVGAINYLTIIECKHWTSTIKKDVVLSLAAKKDSLKAHKAILVTTIGFQKGAIQYAKKNGIGLIKITSSGSVEMVNHFVGNYGAYSDELGKKSKLEDFTNLVSLGIITPNTSVENYFEAKFGIEAQRALHNYLRAGKFPPKGLFKNVPINWSDNYVKIETCGLNIVLSSENLIRQINLLIVFSRQKNFA